MQNNNAQVAFVCTGNTCRSPMGEAIFNKLAEEKGLPVRARSFGLAAVTGMGASPNAIAVCAELGIDLSGFKTNFIYNFDIDGFDKFYCMTPEHAQILRGIGIENERIEVLNVPDPFHGSIEVYRDCRDVIAQRVREIIKGYEN